MRAINLRRSLLRTRKRGTPVSTLHISSSPPESGIDILRRFDPTEFAIHYRDERIGLAEVRAEAVLIRARMEDAYKYLSENIVSIY